MLSKKGEILPAASLLTIITGIAAAFSLWLYLDIAVITTYASAITRICHGIYVQCLDAYQFIKAGFFWLSGALLAAGLIYAALRSVLTLIRTRRALKRLPLKYSGGSVVLIEDRGLKTAFTHGLLRPRIYLSLGLISNLDGPELRGVFLHELHHKRRRDPLRFFLLAFAKNLFFYIPAIAYLEKYLRWSKEHEADDAAASHMAEPFSLAAALLKVVKTNSGTLSVSASITGGNNRGPGTVLERIGRLMGGKTIRFTPPRLKMVVSSLAVACVIIVSLTLPLTTGPVNLKHCELGECSQSETEVRHVCRVHCNIHK